MVKDQHELIRFLSKLRGHNLAKGLASFATNPLILFFFVLLVSSICKLCALNSRELWLDETYSSFVANLRFDELFRYTAGDVHPPLYYIFLWGWIRVFGDAATQLRLFSVVLNICSVFAMLMVARRMLGPRYGAFAAALFALSPILFVYSLEVRMYILSILVFVSLLIMHWIVAVEQSDTKWLVVIYSILAALLFYVHYIGIFVLVGLYVHWMITSAFVRARMARLCAAGILTILFVSPGIPILFEQHSEKAQLDMALRLSNQNPSALSFRDAAQSSIKPVGITVLAKSAAVTAGFYPSASSIFLILYAVPLVVVLAGIVFLGFVKRDEVCRLFSVLSMAVGTGMVTLHLVATRYMLLLIPLLVMAIACVVKYGSAKARWRGPSIAVGTLVFCLYAAGFIRQTFMTHGRPWQNLVGIVQQNYKPGDLIIFDALYPQVTFDYFARHSDFRPQETGFPLSIYDWWEKQKFKGWGGPVIMQSDLDQFVRGISSSRSKTLWLVLYETYYYDPHNALLQRLSQVGQVTEYRFSPDRDTSDSSESQSLRLIRISAN